jgi:hypothetical protein
VGERKFTSNTLTRWQQEASAEKEAATRWQQEKNDKFVIECYLTYDYMVEIGQRRPMPNNSDKWNLKNKKEKVGIGGARSKLNIPK